MLFTLTPKLTTGVIMTLGPTKVLLLRMQSSNKTTGQSSVKWHFSIIIVRLGTYILVTKKKSLSDTTAL